MKLRCGDMVEYKDPYNKKRIGLLAHTDRAWHVAKGMVEIARKNRCGFVTSVGNVTAVVMQRERIEEWWKWL